MFRAFESQANVDPKTLPLHLKEVDFVCLDRIQALAAGAGEEWLTHWILLRRYLEDPSIYAQKAEEHFDTDQGMCGYNEDEVQLQLNRNFLVRWVGEVKGWVRQFPTPEFLKWRRRGISHTVTANHTNRCAVIGITLNDPDLLIATPIVDFCGLILNFSSKQLKVGTKTCGKLDFVTKEWSRIVEKVTNGHDAILDRTLDSALGINSIMIGTRALAVVFGLLQYVHSVQRVGGLTGAAGHYGTCRFMASVSRAAQADPNLWDGGVAVPVRVLLDVEKWLQEVTINPYVRALDDTTMPTKTIFADACEGGWACVVVDHTNGNRHTLLTGSFPTQINGQLSTQTEPWGIVFGMKEALVAGLIQPGEKVHVVNDHLPFMQAAQKGFSPNWHYNMCIAEIRRLPAATVFTYIPGELNPADEPSRGNELSLVKLGRALVEYGYGVDLPLLYTTPSFKKSKESYNSCNKQQSEARSYSLSWLALD
jgi:hypothetical protein